MSHSLWMLNMLNAHHNVCLHNNNYVIAFALGLYVNQNQKVNDGIITYGSYSIIN